MTAETDSRDRAQHLALRPHSPTPCASPAQPPSGPTPSTQAVSVWGWGHFPSSTPATSAVGLTPLPAPPPRSLAAGALLQRWSQVCPPHPSHFSHFPTPPCSRAEPISAPPACCFGPGPVPLPHPLQLWVCTCSPHSCCHTRATTDPHLQARQLAQARWWLRARHQRQVQAWWQWARAQQRPQAQGGSHGYQ